MAKSLTWLKPAVWTGGVMPACALSVQFAQDALGANPIATALNRLGALTLIYLTLTLSCSPAKALLGWTWPLRITRELGLLAFGYASLHLSVYLLDQAFALGSMLDDVAKRPFITVGLTAWFLMLPLAITSTDAWVRRLKFPAWKRLHRLAYVCGVLGVLHFTLRVKKDLTEPLLYATVLMFLFAVRVVTWARKRRPAAAR